MNKEKMKWPNPYRILFPLGTLSGVAGVVLWFMLSDGGISFYPRQAHANIMYFAFLWSFVAGFLMTAVPKMTGTTAAHFFELGAAVLLVVFQLTINFTNQFFNSVLIFGLQSLFLLVFVGRRFLVKRQIPFEGFLFIPFAFGQALLAVALMIRPKGLSADLFYLLAGEAFILNLILGLGTRLIPVLSRVPHALTPDVKITQSNWYRTLTWVILLNLGFWLQIRDQLHLGLGMRLFVLIWVAISGFKIFSSVSAKSFVGIGLRWGVLFMVLSYTLSLLYPAHLMSLQHLLYIGGFVLITFMVGTRVMLAHGGENLTYETDSKRIGFIALLFAFASGFRALAGIETFGLSLKIAIVFFLAGVLIWVHKFLLILKKIGGKNLRL